MATGADAALVKEQGVTFAVVAVKRGVLRQATARDQSLGTVVTFGGVPVVLMEQNSNGTPEYYGRPDLVRFLAGVFLEQLPWAQYQLN